MSNRIISVTIMPFQCSITVLVILSFYLLHLALRRVVVQYLQVLLGTRSPCLKPSEHPGSYTILRFQCQKYYNAHGITTQERRRSEERRVGKQGSRGAT